MSTFESELKKVLHRNLPQSQENVWSKRVEGALVRSEETTYHKNVTIIVDNSISQEEYDDLSDRIIKLIRTDEFYKWSNYRILQWKNNEFKMIAGPKLQVSRVKDDMNRVIPDGSNTGTWEQFAELYKPHKKAGQVIMLTTYKAIVALREAEIPRIKNLLITYCGETDSNLRKEISGIPCIANVQVEKDGNRIKNQSGK